MSACISCEGVGSASGHTCELFVQQHTILHCPDTPSSSSSSSSTYSPLDTSSPSSSIEDTELEECVRSLVCIIMKKIKFL